jgi:hypothetical protein
VVSLNFPASTEKNNLSIPPSRERHHSVSAWSGVEFGLSPECDLPNIHFYLYEAGPVSRGITCAPLAARR